MSSSVTPHDQWNVTEPLALLVKSDHASVLNWLEVRMLLEMESAELAAQRATPQDHEPARSAHGALTRQPTMPPMPIARPILPFT